MAWRFAQISDAHIGSRLANLEPWLANTLRVATREAVAGCFMQAAERGCQAVLIPGDLFDLRGLDPEGCLAFIYQHAARYDKVRFILAPGNADAYGPGSPLSAVSPPENVTVFTSQEWQSVEVGGVLVTGRAIQIGEGMPVLDLGTLPVPEVGQPSVLLLHASLEGAEDGRPTYDKVGSGKGRLSVCPITNAELQRTGYTYAAMGHLHSPVQIKRGGSVIAAYSGTPQCLDWDETGPGGYYFGELKEDGAQLAYEPSARHFWKRRAIELPPPYAESYRQKLDEALAGLVDGLEQGDILQLEARGELHEDSRNELSQALAYASKQVLFCAEPELTAIQYFSGVNPLALPPESLLAGYLSRCAAEAAQSKMDPAIYTLARRIGWLLFTGRGLPAEIMQ
jgi:hypothetical protein